MAMTNDQPLPGHVIALVLLIMSLQITGNFTILSLPLPPTHNTLGSAPSRCFQIEYLQV